MKSIQINMVASSILVLVFFTDIESSAQNRHWRDNEDSLRLMQNVTAVEKLLYSSTDSALFYANALCGDARKIGSDYLLSYGYDLKGRALLEAGLWQPAVALLDSGLQIRIANNWHSEAGQSFLHLGNVYLKEGELHELSSTFTAANDSYVLAKRNYEKALHEITKANDSLWKAHTYLNLGAASYRLYQYEDAIANYTSSAHLFKHTEDSSLLPGIMSNIGVVYETIGREDSAYFFYFRARKAYQRDKDFRNWINANLNLASLFAGAKPDDALYFLNEADSLSVLFNYTLQQALVQQQLYSVHEQQRKYRQALHHLKNYHVLKDSMLNKDFKTEELNVRYQTSKQKELIERQKTENLEKELALTKAHAKNEQMVAWGSVVGIGIVAILVVTFWRRRTEKKMHQKELVHLEGVKKLEAAQAMLAGQEKERARVAEDLHDRLGSILTAAQMQFDASRDERNTDGEYNFLKGQSLLSRAINDTRTISHNLISGVLTNLGLASALRDLKESIEASDKLKIELEVETVPRFDINTELQLFRAAQEVVHNSVKHSGASTLSIALWTHGKSLFLSIEDNGKGFDVEAVNKGLGLKNIERRISSIEGTCNFRTAPGKGCFFSVELQIASYENTENTHSR